MTAHLMVWRWFMRSDDCMAGSEFALLLCLVIVACAVVAQILGPVF